MLLKREDESQVFQIFFLVIETNPRKDKDAELQRHAGRFLRLNDGFPPCLPKAPVRYPD